MTKMQTNMVKAATAFSKIYERMPEGQEKQIMKDGLTLLAQSTRQVSYLRREKQRCLLTGQRWAWYLEHLLHHKDTTKCQAGRHATCYMTNV